VIDQLFKTQWNIAPAAVLTISALHNTEFYRNQGLSLSRPLEATTNYQRRSLTGAVSNRAVVAGKIFETTVQWSRDRESDLPKGAEPMQVRPEGWRGNFFTERRTNDERIHIAQTVAWEMRSHRFKTGVEIDDVQSDLFFNRRDFDVFNARGVVESRTQFVGPTGASTHNREYGAFVQDRIAVLGNVQIEPGLRIDREEVIGRTNLGPRFAFSYLPRGGDRSKISGGFGVFYDNVPLENFQLPHLQRRNATALTVDPNLKNPYGIHWNLSWEQEWKTRWVTRINYVQKRARDQIRLGAPLEVNNSGSSRYRALELSLDRPIRTNLRLHASYVYSIDKARPSLSADFPDPAVDAISEARTGWDVPHRLLAWAYFPFLLETNGSFSVEARSGFPYTAIDDENHVVGGYNAARFPTFFVVNGSFEKVLPLPFRKRMALRVGMLNILDRFNPRSIDLNVNSPTYGKYSDSTGRAFVARLRIVK
jgi:outer membrane receptor protein involved in Fe transport